MVKIQIRDKIACVKQKYIRMFHSFRPTEIRAQYRQRAGWESQEGGGGDPNQSADSYLFRNIREYNPQQASNHSAEIVKVFDINPLVTYSRFLN
jgi:hypothetical protein